MQLRTTATTISVVPDDFKRQQADMRRAAEKRQAAREQERNESAQPAPAAQPKPARTYNAIPVKSPALFTPVMPKVWSKPFQHLLSFCHDDVTTATFVGKFLSALNGDTRCQNEILFHCLVLHARAQSHQLSQAHRDIINAEFWLCRALFKMLERKTSTAESTAVPQSTEQKSATRDEVK